MHAFKKYDLIEALIIVNCRYDNCIKGTEIKHEQFDFVFIKCYKFTLKSFSCAINNRISFIHSTRLGLFIKVTTQNVDIFLNTIYNEYMLENISLYVKSLMSAANIASLIRNANYCMCKKCIMYKIHSIIILSMLIFC